MRGTAARNGVVDSRDSIFSSARITPSLEADWGVNLSSDLSGKIVWQWWRAILSKKEFESLEFVGVGRGGGARVPVPCVQFWVGCSFFSFGYFQLRGSGGSIWGNMSRLTYWVCVQAERTELFRKITTSCLRYLALPPHVGYETRFPTDNIVYSGSKYLWAVFKMNSLGDVRIPYAVHVRAFPFSGQSVWVPGRFYDITNMHGCGGVSK